MMRYTVTYVSGMGCLTNLRVDYGREFYLCLYQQDNLQAYRRNTTRPPYIQSQSKQNHTAERKWVEVNSRVNYPIKSLLSEMANEDLIDMDDQCTKFCISEFAQSCCRIGIKKFVSAWNAHTIPQKGIPDVLFQVHKATTSVPEGLLPPVRLWLQTTQCMEDALHIQQYMELILLSDNLNCKSKGKHCSQTDNFEDIFCCAVIGRADLFKEAVITFVDTSFRLL